MEKIELKLPFVDGQKNSAEENELMVRNTGSNLTVDHFGIDI